MSPVLTGNKLLSHVCKCWVHFLLALTTDDVMICNGLLSLLSSLLCVHTTPLVTAHTHTLQVVLSGGSCRVPLVQAVVRQAFPSCPVLCSLPPEEGVALGAALEAELLASPHPFPHQPPHTHTHKMPCSSADLWIVVCSNGSSSPCVLVCVCVCVCV